MNKTSIEWTDYTWNPVTGCHKVSQGCKNCYAETLTNRFGKVWGVGSFRQVICHPDRLMEPIYMGDKLAGKKVFVCDMSDLFHDDVPVDFIADVFEHIWNCRDTTFQILTKRPARALALMEEISDRILVELPFKNVWFGVSCEDQETADERIPLLLAIDAKVRFLSCEPLLGPIDLSPYTDGGGIHWVIAGGESGRNSRPMHPDWARSLRDQCASASVPFFFKQWGEWLPNHQQRAEGTDSPGPYLGDPMEYTADMDRYNADLKRWEIWRQKNTTQLGNLFATRYGKSRAGNFLDGKQHLEFPKTFTPDTHEDNH